MACNDSPARSVLDANISGLRVLLNIDDNASVNQPGKILETLKTCLEQWIATAGDQATVGKLILAFEKLKLNEFAQILTQWSSELQSLEGYCTATW